MSLESIKPSNAELTMTPMTFLAALLLVPLLWLSPCAWADERKVTPTVALKQEYTDNLFFSSDDQENDRESDFISTISPGLELVNNTERLKAGLNLRVDSLYYQENSSLDSLDQDHSGSLRYALSTRTNLFSSAGYRRDSRPDRDLMETGLVLNDATRDQYRFKLGGDYALSEVTGTQLQYSYAEDAYKSGQFDDYQSHDVAWMINRDLSSYLANTVGRINLGVTEYKNEDSDVTNYYGTLGAERKLSELYSYFADFGLRYTESTVNGMRLVPTEIPFLFRAEPYEEQTDGTGFTGRAGITYQGELNNGRLFVSHDVQAASGKNGTVERTALQGNVGRRLTETSHVALSTGYAINKSTEDSLDTETVDEDSLWLEPRITYTLSERITLEGSYNYALVNDNETNTETDRNLVMLRLRYNYPLFE